MEKYLKSPYQEANSCLNLDKETSSPPWVHFHWFLKVLSQRLAKHSVCWYQGGGFTGDAFCTKHNSPTGEKKNLQFIKHSSSKGRLTDGGSLGGNFGGGGLLPHLSSFSKHSFPTNHTPSRGWQQRETPSLLLPPLSPGSRTPVHVADAPQHRWAPGSCWHCPQAHAGTLPSSRQD